MIHAASPISTKRDARWCYVKARAYRVILACGRLPDKGSSDNKVEFLGVGVSKDR